MGKLQACHVDGRENDCTTIRDKALELVCCLAGFELSHCSRPMISSVRESVKICKTIPHVRLGNKSHFG